MIIALIVVLLMALGVAGWWYYTICEAENARARAAAAAFESAKRDGEAADRRVKDSMDAARRLKNR